MKKKLLSICFIAIIMFSRTASAQWGHTDTTDTFNNAIQTICTDTFGNIYAAGYFKNSSGNYYVAKWDGSSWSELGGLNALAANGPINAICSDPHGRIYAGGDFQDSRGYTYIAEWNGNTWFGAGGYSGEVNNSINTLCSDPSGNICAAGDFTDANNNFYVLKSSGAYGNWTPLGGTTLAANKPIAGICSDTAGNIYAVGTFTNGSTDTTGSYYVAKYNGNTWSELGGHNSLNSAYSPFNPGIQTVFSDRSGNIYTGHYDSLSFLYASEFNGSSWTTLGGPNAINGLVSSFCIDPSGHLYASGQIYDIYNYQYVAEWDGSSWNELGPYLAANNNIYSICSDSRGNIYAGGSFTDSSGNNYVAKYTNYVNGITDVSVLSSLRLYPNPASNTVNISSGYNFQSIKIIDQTGEIVQHTENLHSNQHTLSVATLAKGIYYVQVAGNDNTIMEKLVIE